MNELALFAGAGGGILGGKMLGWRTVCAVEIEEYPRKVLMQRQADGWLKPFPIWDDIRSFDGRPWRGIVDVVSGGFPCQDISSNGKGAGISGERSGLWKEMARVVCEVQPSFVIVENSPALIRRGLGVVLGDLAEMGYDSEWCCISAESLGAKHERERIWILSYSNEVRLEGHDMPHTIQLQTQTGNGTNKGAEFSWDDIPEPYYIRSVDGVAYWVDRLKAIGNGQVPLQMAMAFSILMERAQAAQAGEGNND